MKKILKSIVAVLVIVSSLLMLASCSPKKDFYKAEENLKNDGYSVTVIRSDDDNEHGIETKLTASKSESSETFEIVMIEFESTKLAKLYYQSLRMQIQNQIEENKLAIKAMKHMVNKFKDDLSTGEIDEYKNAIEDLKEENKELREQLRCTGRSGKIVWYGDPEAIAATK
jgi:hypothetical protein